MLLESFISTQKLSVQKTLARKFGRFVSFRRDCAELLLATLQATHHPYSTPPCANMEHCDTTVLKGLAHLQVNPVST